MKEARYNEIADQIQGMIDRNPKTANRRQDTLRHMLAYELSQSQPQPELCHVLLDMAELNNPRRQHYSLLTTKVVERLATDASDAEVTVRADLMPCTLGRRAEVLVTPDRPVTAVLASLAGCPEAN